MGYLLKKLWIRVFVGCDNAEYSVLHNQAYISQTGTNPNTALKVFIDQDLVTANLNVVLRLTRRYPLYIEVMVKVPSEDLWVGMFREP